MNSNICLVAVDVRSTHNVGSFFRTCDAFGAELFLVGICPRPIAEDDDRLPHIAKKATQQIAKTALGAETSVRWRYSSSFKDAVEALRTEGYKIVALEQSVKSTELKNLIQKKKIALVVGREVEGLRDDELALCDTIVEITMMGKKESLNVSVAAGIGLYQIVSCR